MKYMFKQNDTISVYEGEPEEIYKLINLMAEDDVEEDYE